MSSYTGGTPVIGGAQWNGNQLLATRKQLLSSINGLYLDIQDIELSSITATTLNVSTLTASQWISTPELYVSSIIGGGLQVNDGFLQISTGNISLVSLSTLQFKGIDLGGVSFNFDLGLGNAIGGFLGGLGALVGGAFIGLGTGTGLAIQGITNGLFSLANTRGDSITNINSNVFETINGTTQLQISTLGNVSPFYSSIFRSVSSLSPNSVPGQEVFLSTIFPAGTTCVRSVSDPLPLLTNNSTINTSTIQSFGEWVPFLDPTPTGEDIIARYGYFSTLFLNSPPTLVTIDCTESNVAPNKVGLMQTVNIQPTVNNYNVTSNQTSIATSLAQYYSIVDTVYGNNTINFISSPYNQYTSTIGNYLGGVYFLTSTITSGLSTIPKFIYTGNEFGGGNFAVCEPDETSFLSTYTLDLVAQSSNVLLQWGLALNNLNSTIAQGTAKRISWDIPGNTSNFIDIPVPQSTTITNTQTNYQLVVKPLEVEFQALAIPDNGSGGGRAGMVFDINRAVFGGNTTYQNQVGYPYQFNGNVFINGNLEADTLIAISSIVNVSTNLQTFFSTQTFDADEATISSLVVTSFLASPLASISSLITSSFIANDITTSTLISADMIEGNGISTFGIESYTFLNQFSYISTLVVDLQILEGIDGVVTTRLNNIQGTINSSRINMNRGTFTSLSTTNISTGNLFVDSTNGNTLTITNGSFSNLTASNTFNGNQLFGQNATFSTVTTSTLNVNTISTTSHTGSDITCDNITINDFATFPSVGNLSNVITMTFSNTTNSNQYTPFQATLIEGSVFPQTSNEFSITTSGSNTTIQDYQGLIFQTVTGNTVIFGSGIDTVELTAADFFTRSVKYGTSAGGYLQPRAFAQQYQQGLGSSDNLTTYTQVTDSNSNTFLVSDYNFMPCMMGFNMLNTAVAVNEVIIRPYQSNGYWWVRLDVYLNAGAAGNDMIWYWNNLLFPYNMMT